MHFYPLKLTGMRSPSLKAGFPGSHLHSTTTALMRITHQFPYPGMRRDGLCTLDGSMSTGFGYLHIGGLPGLLQIGLTKLQLCSFGYQTLGMLSSSFRNPLSLKYTWPYMFFLSFLINMLAFIASLYICFTHSSLPSSKSTPVWSSQTCITRYVHNIYLDEFYLSAFRNESTTHQRIEESPCTL